MGSIPWDHLAVEESDGRPASGWTVLESAPMPWIAEREGPEDLYLRRDCRGPQGIAAGTRGQEDARKLARDPNERTLVDGEGRVWIVAPVERPEPAAGDDRDFDRPSSKIRYFGDGKAERLGHPSPGRRLGEASREELLDLVRD